MKDRYLDFERVSFLTHIGTWGGRFLVDAGFLLLIWLAVLVPCVGYSEEDRVVAVVGGEEITQRELTEEIAEYGKKGSFQEKLLTLTSEGKEEILNRLVKERLLYRAAQDEGVTLAPEDAKHLERLKRELLVKEYVTQVLANNASSDGELYDYYLKCHDQFSEPEKRKIRHIVVKTREEAEGLRARLDAGEVFETLARQYNIDGAEERGGDLGWVTKGLMVPEFERVAFSISKGEVSDSVNTPFGWHLIRVEDIQKTVHKGFGEVKKQVKAMAEQEALKNLKDRLRNSYQVKIIDKQADEIKSKD